MFEHAQPELGSVAAPSSSSICSRWNALSNSSCNPLCGSRAMHPLWRHDRTICRWWGCPFDRLADGRARPQDGHRALPDHRPTANRMPVQAPRGSHHRRHDRRAASPARRHGQAARPDTAHARRDGLRRSRRASAAACRPRPTRPRDTRPGPLHCRGIGRPAPSCRLAGATAPAPLPLIQHPAVVRPGPRALPLQCRSDRPQTAPGAARARPRLVNRSSSSRETPPSRSASRTSKIALETRPKALQELGAR